MAALCFLQIDPLGSDPALFRYLCADERSGEGRKQVYPKRDQHARFYLSCDQKTDDEKDQAKHQRRKDSEAYSALLPLGRDQGRAKERA